MLLGIVTMAVVAYSNSLTSVLLLRAAGLTGHDSYEGVAYAIGGKGWKVGRFSERQGSSDRPLNLSVDRRAFDRLPAIIIRLGAAGKQHRRLLLQVVTQVALILLLVGTVIGDFALLADVGQRALTRLTPGHAPAVLADHDGRGIMILLVLLVVFPLCLLKR